MSAQDRNHTVTNKGGPVRSTFQSLHNIRTTKSYKPAGVFRALGMLPSIRRAANFLQQFMICCPSGPCSREGSDCNRLILRVQVTYSCPTPPSIDRDARP